MKLLSIYMWWGITLGFGEACLAEQILQMLLLKLSWRLLSLLKRRGSAISIGKYQRILM